MHPVSQSFPLLKSCTRNYSKDKVKVILVSNDFKKHVETRLIPFVRKKKLKSQVLFMDESNPNDWIDMVSTEWSGAIPATIIISKRKNKVLFFEKALKYKELKKAVLSVL